MSKRISACGRACMQCWWVLDPWGCCCRFTTIPCTSARFSSKRDAWSPALQRKSCGGSWSSAAFRSAGAFTLTQQPTHRHRSECCASFSPICKIVAAARTSVRRCLDTHAWTIDCSRCGGRPICIFRYGTTINHLGCVSFGFAQSVSVLGLVQLLPRT